MLLGLRMGWSHITWTFKNDPGNSWSLRGSTCFLNGPPRSMFRSPFLLVCSPLSLHPKFLRYTILCTTTSLCFAMPKNIIAFCVITNCHGISNLFKSFHFLLVSLSSLLPYFSFKNKFVIQDLQCLYGLSLKLFQVSALFKGLCRSARICYVCIINPHCNSHAWCPLYSELGHGNR